MSDLEKTNGKQTALSVPEEHLPEDIKLTGKQKRFADYYVAEAALNATRAARLAGYAGDENVLSTIGSKLVRNGKVRAYIDRQLDEAGISASEIIAILTRQAKGSLADVLDEDGNFDLKDAKRRGVDVLMKEIEIKKTVRKDENDKPVVERQFKYKIHDPQSAAVHLARIRGLMNDRQGDMKTGEVVIITFNFGNSVEVKR